MDGYLIRVEGKVAIGFIKRAICRMWFLIMERKRSAMISLNES